MNAIATDTATTADTNEVIEAVSVLRDYHENGGCDWMELIDAEGWAILGVWGCEGWDLGQWPYVMIAVTRHVRHHRQPFRCRLLLRRTYGSISGKAQADQLLAEAERADKARRRNVEADNAKPEQPADETAATYDLAERRKAVQARLNADRNHATPPAAAVSSSRGKATKARTVRTALALRSNRKKT
ncbi:hypothetical protein ARTHRO9AX_220242 [Arthrobacter sp. 9AX]|uniref:hypothetical protein n=1 Tax=Arthrobacter sp. 9AX TaxID=2653131 RepID=UPI0012F09F42|nr:hypothetical protein [Arthrobacter sp. 9AX]VXC21109.1 hypothetical protein ARTHRO9AX_220242 [Arthrobacter sp. 9AX]